MTRAAVALTAVVGLAHAATAQPRTLTPADVLARVEATYAKIQQLTATFDQR